jgi:hypothetical protein
MNQETLENTLRRLMRRRPFFPFSIELDSGDRIEVDAPDSMAWGGGAAGFLSSTGEPTLFRCDQVVRIIANEPETVS